MSHGMLRGCCVPRLSRRATANAGGATIAHPDLTFEIKVTAQMLQGPTIKLGGAEKPYAG